MISYVVERVSIYRYLGTLIDDKLTFQQNTDAVYKKCQQRMYLLRKLRSLNIRPDILKAFYSSHIESVVTFSFLSWFGGLTVSNVNKLQTVVNTCTKICGTECKSMKSLYGKRALVKATKITNDASHALAQYFDMLPSGNSGPLASSDSLTISGHIFTFYKHIYKHTDCLLIVKPLTLHLNFLSIGD